MEDELTSTVRGSVISAYYTSQGIGMSHIAVNFEGLDESVQDGRLGGADSDRLGRISGLKIDSPCGTACAGRVSPLNAFSDRW